MSTHTYRQEFFDYIETGSLRSASIVVPLARQMLRVESVLDVGCGRGAWLSEWSRQDVSVTGVDGSYVDRKSLLIPESRFIAADLSRPIDLGRKFDLVQSLEVAEHLPEAAADTFVDTLARHGPTILFSAAVPGQGGEHHVNEQPYDYWRDKFRRRGYLAFDALRPMLTGDHRVEPWYRYNVLLFIAESETGRLSPSLASARLPDGAAIPDVSPLSFRLRKSIFRRLPPPWVSQLAVVKHKITNRARSRAAS